jgi:hypothetical protein
MECLDKQQSAEKLILALEDRLAEAQSTPTKLCAVFDIDDTLISEESFPISDVIALKKTCLQFGCTIGLVTARHPSMRKVTIDELRGVNILDGIDYAPEDLFFCPEDYRSSFVKISQWKKSARKFLKNKYGPVFVTAGDQWTDLIEISSEEERKFLDDAYGTDINPYQLFKLHDGISSYGLKLKSSPVVLPKFTMVQGYGSAPQTLL